jgi:ribose transport system permease protein
MTTKTAFAPENPRLWDRFLQLFHMEAIGILIALVVLCAAITLLAPHFLSGYNLTVVTRQASFVGLIALGQTLVLLLGGIDLSVGANSALSAVVGALFLTVYGVHPYLVIPLTMVFGLLLGLVNGAVIAGMRLSPFIVTLATWEIFAGMNLVITEGYPVRPLGPEFSWFGQASLLGIPIPVLAFLLAAIVLIWVLGYTRFGRNIYSIGGNRAAATLVGIRVVRVETLVYGISGMLAALAGILYASRMDSAQPSVGEGWLMPAITAAIIGGTSLSGGQGTIIGTVLGTLLMAALSNGMSLLNVSGFWERVVVGGVVLVAVLADFIRRRS